MCHALDVGWSETLLYASPGHRRMMVVDSHVLKTLVEACSALGVEGGDRVAGETINFDDVLQLVREEGHGSSARGEVLYGD